MIDMHVHAVHPRLPGVQVFSALVDGSHSLIAANLRQAAAEVGVTHLLGMGCLSKDVSDPLGIEATLAIAELMPSLSAIGVADPRRSGDDHFAAVESQIQSGKVKALKGYLGYLHFGPDDTAYFPYYELAQLYDIAFIFHTGDTYAKRAKVKYAHPLLIDEVAVDFPRVKFVLAHVGNPWLVDAAEVIYKNENVWADLSGLLVGDDAYFYQLLMQGNMETVADRIKFVLDYTEKPDRFLYGSDWPLAPMKAYREFILRTVPADWQQAVFETNAKLLFHL